MIKKRNALIIGGSGFLGYNVLKELTTSGWKVRNMDLKLPDKRFIIDGVDYVCNDLFDQSKLENALDDIDAVFYFISTTFPNTDDKSLGQEINKTLLTLDYVLSTMVKKSVHTFVFPSSGGAVYGEELNLCALETDMLHPKTAYGVGKQMSEQIINFYFEKHMINSYIFRIGNVYGSSMYRDKPQGVIDVFVQNAISDKPIHVWGNADSVIRDYIYIDDVADAIVNSVNIKREGVITYNVGTGVGTSVKEIIEMIENLLNKSLTIINEPEISSGINKIVLNTRKIKNEIGWSSELNIRKGIELTILRKKGISGS